MATHWAKGERAAASMLIGELSARTCRHIEAIRYYERIGLLPPAAGSAGGQRVYDPEKARRLHVVGRARELGSSLEEVRVLHRLADERVEGARAQEVDEGDRPSEPA